MIMVLPRYSFILIMLFALEKIFGIRSVLISTDADESKDFDWRHTNGAALKDIDVELSGAT